MATKASGLVRSILLLTLSLIFFSSSSSAALINITRTDVISISVEVAERTLVDISPSALSWTTGQLGAVDPGSTGASAGIQIDNIGSTNISYIWFNTTYEASRPFGIGNPALYDPGNFVQIKRNTTTGIYYFVNRVEYNESKPIYVTLPAGCTTLGKFREGGEEFFWCLDPGGDGNSPCNYTDTTFYVGKVAHNQSQTGTVDLSGAADPGGLKGTGAQDIRSGVLEGFASGWGWADVIVGQNAANKNYTIATKFDCTSIHFYHWNKDAPGATAAANDFAEYFVYPAMGILAPGGSAVGNVRVKVPYGVTSGLLPTQGTLTVLAMAVDVTA